MPKFIAKEEDGDLCYGPFNTLQEVQEWSKGKQRAFYPITLEPPYGLDKDGKVIPQIKITHKGIDPDEVIWEGTCSSCRSVGEIARKYLDSTNEASCPVCEGKMVFEKKIPRNGFMDR